MLDLRTKNKTNKKKTIKKKQLKAIINSARLHFYLFMDYVIHVFSYNNHEYISPIIQNN